MPRIVTYGQQPASAPPGTFRAIHFTPLMLLDTGTVEGYLSRLFESDGAGVRDAMPLTISMQYTDAGGHDMAVPVGALHEVFIDGENKVMTGKGWLADTPDGHLAEILVLSKSLHHNSADIGEIPPNGLQLEYDGDPWDDDFKLTARFTNFKLAKTTLVAQPAFAPAIGMLPEIAASLGGDEPLIVDQPAIASSHSSIEIIASMSALPPFDYFHRPESDIPHKLQVDEPDENGWCHVYGHIARWNQPHTGYDGASVYAPRSRDGYSVFCQPSVLTDRGMVATGPIVLYGGHISLKDAADDPKNAWSDVRVTDGRHGPWVSGVARPHIAYEMAERYVARASRTSGHWKGGHLRMIISCSAEGYPIPHSAEADELVASFAVENAGALAIPKELLSLDSMPQDTLNSFLETLRTHLAEHTGDAPEIVVIEDDAADSSSDEWDVDAARREREALLSLEDDDES